MRTLLIALAAVAADGASAQVTSDAAQSARVTIYRGAGDGRPPTTDAGEDEWSRDQQRRNGLAFISETRTLELPAGRTRIQLRGVADTMVPETAAIEDLPGAVIERNQDYNLLSPASLLAGFIDKPVRLVSTDRASGAVSERRAIVRSGPGYPVLEMDGGGFEGLRCSGAPERLVFDAAPADLADKPTFSVWADVTRAGRYTVRLSYLATGFTWLADYVAKLAPDGRSLDLIGWLTLSNSTAADYARTPVEVVAGQLSQDESTVPPKIEHADVWTSCWPVVHQRALATPSMDAAIPPLPVPPVPEGLNEIVVTAYRKAAQSELGDYKLYKLPEPTNLAARQTKQVLFLQQARVAVERVYTYRFDIDDEPAEDEDRAPRVTLRLKNEASKGLGEPLPAGVVSVMAPGVDGRLILAGKAEIRDTAVGLPLELELGGAQGVSVVARTLSQSSKGDRTEATIEARLANLKAEAVTVEYRQARSGENFRIGKASRRPDRKTGEPTWTIGLQPGQEVVLRYNATFLE